PSHLGDGQKIEGRAALVPDRQRLAGGGSGGGVPLAPQLLAAPGERRGESLVVLVLQRRGRGWRRRLGRGLAAARGGRRELDPDDLDDEAAAEARLVLDGRRGA